MERRTAESPMDFEWQTRAPGDVTSPFYQLGLQHDPHKKRDYTVFDSPSKIKQTSQSFNFAQPSPQRPISPSRANNAIFGKPAFQTPRKFDADVSSGPENNMSSPENADNEDTPEPVQKREKRNSLFNLYGRFAPSPGRGGIAKLTRPATDQARRVHKRRLRDRDIDRYLGRDSGNDSDRPSSREEKRSRREGKRAAAAAAAATATATAASTTHDSGWRGFFSFLNEHPHLPTILSYWLQLLWNLIIFGLVTWVVVSFILSIKNDINHAADDKRNEIIAEIFDCRERYDKNRCGVNERPPALNDVCNNWERCMDQDPDRVARATVSVQTISAIVSSFVDAISLKAFSFFLLTVATLTVASNWSFVAFRNQCARKDDPYAYPPSPSKPPPTPYHQHPPLAFPEGNPYPLEYPKTPGRSGSPIRQRDHETNTQDERLLLEDSPSLNMNFVTSRSREREQHLHTPSPSKRERFA
ncbi:Di-sulfide bridge nucleocytoplasmic transport domain-containing protein [Talaromyces proteolyticus]|uniref:Di-sulfide bridge nucleocytoplasmic transport domain-containing protein n=1 Tax=Talaromyces proteolyticus TaxID=1131652 RepID=A0AAD4KJI0_9EURO|nr:Di-sulfide bridge nucleocytoplasmic transport domain-containing protein [Talaromyces proteolyticus]KAH8689956.1 Di-sulfide bridge nucleocytoplasmic transport domain-containing protein [Talaromyces proteolyticus]